MLEDKDGGGDEPSGEDATIKDRSLETGEEACIEKSNERGSNDTEEMANVLTSLDATSILTSGVQAVTYSYGEGSRTPTEPHHTPPPEAQQSSPTAPSSPILPPVTTKLIPTVIPTETLPLRQYTRRARIAQSSALPTTKMASKLIAQELEIASLKARIKMLEDKDGGGDEPSGEDATIKERSLETGEEACIEKSNERGKVAIVSVPTGSGLVPTASLIFTTASVVTPYSRRKGKEKMIESDTPKKKKLQEQINEYEQFAADLFIEENIDMINELVKYQDHYAKVLKYQSQQRKPLSKKQQREFYMSVLKSHSGWKIKHFKGMSLEEIREKFILVWKQIEDFVPMASKEEGERFKGKGLRLEQGSAKKMKTSEEVSKEDLKAMIQLVPVEEVYKEALQVKHPIIKWEIYTEGQRNYWKIIRLGGHTAVYQFFVDMLKHFDREDLTQLWTLVKESLSIRQATSDKEKELWVELKRLYEPDVEDQLWTYTQALMHDPVEWRLYDTCGVHHVLSRDQEIFIRSTRLQTIQDKEMIEGILSSPIFTTATMTTPYSRQKDKEKMVESDTPKKKKLQEQIDVHVAREMEEQMMLIDGLDKNNEVIARHLHDYEQAAAELTIGEKIELINELVKYQDHHSKIIKYQAQQSKPFSKKQQREFYMSVLRSHTGWKTKHFKESSEDKESLGDQEDASKQGRMTDNIGQDVEITLVDETQGRMNEEEMFIVNDLDDDEVIMDGTTGEEVEHSTKVAKKEVSTVDPVTTADEVVTTDEDVEVTTAATTLQISKDKLTLAQTLIEIKAAKPKARCKGMMVEPKKPLKKKDQIAFDEEVARKLKAQMKAKMEEEERIAREKDEAYIVVIEQWDEVQANINGDIELAQKLQTKEQEQLTDAEKARLFMEFLEKRKKFFARKREIEKRNRPPTKAQ
nr:hypothetical protein [Tanacetum cinerariifolium]